MVYIAIGNTTRWSVLISYEKAYVAELNIGSIDGCDCVLFASFSCCWCCCSFFFFFFCAFCCFFSTLLAPPSTRCFQNPAITSVRNVKGRATVSHLTRAVLEKLPLPGAPPF